MEEKQTKDMKITIKLTKDEDNVAVMVSSTESNKDMNVTCLLLGLSQVIDVDPDTLAMALLYTSELIGKESPDEDFDEAKFEDFLKEVSKSPSTFFEKEKEKESQVKLPKTDKDEEVDIASLYKKLDALLDLYTEKVKDDN